MADDTDNEHGGGKVEYCEECGKHHTVSPHAAKYQEIARRMTLGMQAVVTKAVAELPADADNTAQAFLMHFAIKSIVFFGSANAWHMSGHDASAARNLVGHAITSASHDFDQFISNGGVSPGDLSAIELNDPSLAERSADDLTDELVAQAEAKANKTRH